MEAELVSFQRKRPQAAKLLKYRVTKRPFRINPRPVAAAVTPCISRCMLGQTTTKSHTRCIQLQQLGRRNIWAHWFLETPDCPITRLTGPHLDSSIDDLQRHSRCRHLGSSNLSTRCLVTHPAGSSSSSSSTSVITPSTQQKAGTAGCSDGRATRRPPSTRKRLCRMHAAKARVASQAYTQSTTHHRLFITVKPRM
jgi:hypothetical protein